MNALSSSIIEPGRFLDHFSQINSFLGYQKNKEGLVELISNLPKEQDQSSIEEKVTSSSGIVYKIPLIEGETKIDQYKTQTNATVGIVDSIKQIDCSLKQSWVEDNESKIKICMSVLVGFILGFVFSKSLLPACLIAVITLFSYLISETIGIDD